MAGRSLLERRHDAEALRDLLDRGLEEHPAIRRLQARRVHDGRFEDALARLGVQALERRREGGQVVEDRAEVRFSAVVCVASAL